jgi:general L-amino acid transport system permease protein
VTQTTATAADPTGINRLWRDEHARGIILQLALALGLALFVAFIVSNTIANLQSAGLAAGYGFLDDTASFDINQRLIEYASTSTYGRAIVVGGLNTILVAALGIVTATIIGFTAGVLRLSNNFLISRLVAVYVEFTRNVPDQIQIIYWWDILLDLQKVRDSMSISDYIIKKKSGISAPDPVFL